MYPSIELPGISNFLKRPPWQAQAACRGRGTAAFVLDVGGNSRTAKALCESCPVCDDCLAFALADDQLEGVWGGTTGKERRRMRRASA